MALETPESERLSPVPPTVGRAPRVVEPLVLMFVAAALACDGDVSASQVAKVTSAFERAFDERELERLRSAAETLEQTLPCVSERLAPTDVARIHRVFAMSAFVADDRAASIAAFEAAKHIEPGFVFGDDTLSAKHPLRVLYEGLASAPPPGPRDLGVPPEGWLHVDGRQGRMAPVSRPWLYQRFDADGGVAETAYFAVGEHPAPFRRRVARRQLQLTVGALAVPNDLGGQLQGELLGTLVLGVNPHLSFAVATGAGVLPEEKAVETERGVELRQGVTGLWGVRAGFRVHPRSAGVRPWAGIAGVVLFHDFASENLFTPGGVAQLGIDVPLGDRVGWPLALEAGATTPHAPGEGILPLAALRTGVALYF